MNLFSPPPIRRVLVIDPGSRSIKTLLASRRGDGVEVVQHSVMDLLEGKANTPESQERVERLLEGAGAVPVALILPQQYSISQVIDLPKVEPEKVKGLIKEEIAKFSGLSEGMIVHDYGKLNPIGKYQNPYWVTFAKEEEILGEASRLPGVGERLCDIITPANALVATYQSLPSQSENAMLVELGATGTVVALVVQRQPAYAIHFPLGGEAFADAQAVGKSPTPTGGTTPLRLSLPNEEFGTAPLRAAVDGWRLELEKILRDWLRENPELNLSANSFRVLLGGGGARQAGLLKYLRSTSHLRFTEWPVSSPGKNELPLDRYAIAYGVALKSLGVSQPSASLFPLDLREARKRRHSQESLQKVTWIVLGAVALLLLLGTARKWSLTQKKNALLKQSQAILQEATAVEALHQQWEEGYEQLRPVLKQQKRTIDTLVTLSELQKVRGDKKLWHVLLADQKSYFNGQTVVPPPGEINLDFSVFTNPAPVEKNGFITELALAEEGEGMRQTLSKVVAELKNNPAFQNVDTLSPDQRKLLVNTNVILPGRHFALSIELTNVFENPLPAKAPKAVKREANANSRFFRSLPFRSAAPSAGGKN